MLGEGDGTDVVGIRVDVGICVDFGASIDVGVRVDVGVCVDGKIDGCWGVTSSITISSAIYPVPLSLPQGPNVSFRVGVLLEDNAACCPINNLFTLHFFDVPRFLVYSCSSGFL